jgi:hypothetical protein
VSHSVGTSLRSVPTILDSIKQEIPLLRVPDVCVDEEAVHFVVDVFNLGLKGVECFAFGDLDLHGERERVGTRE